MVYIVTDNLRQTIFLFRKLFIMILTALQVLLNSKLPIDVLGRVWELADIDKDGMLDSDEFAVVRKNSIKVINS